MRTQFVKNEGFILLLIVLSLLAIGAAALFTGLIGGKSSERRIAEGATADQRLLFARDALLGYAVGNIADSGRPGQLPAPDTLQDNNYNGNANNGGCLDGTAVNGQPALSGGNANLRCLGKLPWKTLGISSDGVDEYDATGIVPWYGVSANLAATNTCLTYLNPGTVAATPVAFACPSNTGPPFPWLKVCDQTGRLLSDRVAFVVIVPGEPLTTAGRTQTRKRIDLTPPLPQPSDYLDAIPLPAGWSGLPAAQRCTTYDNAALSNEFVTADALNGFNDRLLFVTIDELMARVENRVAQQAREALVSYQAAYGRYPWLAPIGNPSSVTDGFIAVAGTNAGLLPFNNISQKFKTEATWAIGTSGTTDVVAPATSSSPGFFCFGNAYRCQLRTSPGTAAIPRSVTTAQFAALKASTVATPSIQCSYSTLTVLNCDTYTYTQTQAVNYDVQRRPNPPNSGAYSYYGTFAGVQTRTITLTFTAIQASGSATFSADPAFFVRRSLTTNSSTDGAGLLSVVDSWVPNTAGIAPFDLTASMQTGSSATAGLGVMTVSNIRVYPTLPSWYADHKWNEFIYAAISSDASPTVGGNTCTANCFSAGVRTGLHAIVISSGKMINTQNRYLATPSVTDFLEAPNSTGTATRTFAETNASQSSSYADTVITIPR